MIVISETDTFNADLYSSLSFKNLNACYNFCGVAGDNILPPTDHLLNSIALLFELEIQRVYSGGISQTYETLREPFPSVSNVLRAVPGAEPADLQRLDDKLAAHAHKPAKLDKSKRDLFKKITAKVSPLSHTVHMLLKGSA